MQPAYRRPAASPRRTSRPQPTTAGWVAIIIFGFLAGLGAIAAVAAVGVYTALASDDLPKPETLNTYVLPEETVILDRTGKRELARFGDARREVVTFDEIPPLVLDATTSIEDKTFWENAGFDPVAIVAAGLDSLRGNSRGASTITQQLVRQRLLPTDLVQDPDRTVERKLKEIIQSIRVTQAFPDEDVKKAIITAYLNQNYYGNQSYGIKAAAQAYFGVELAELTPAQAAILAALPKSPSNYDLVRNATERCTQEIAEGATCPANKTELVVPDDTTIVERRNAILDFLAAGRTPMSRDEYSAADFRAAKNEEVVLASQTTARWVAPHFVWAVRDELTERLCGQGATTCDALDRGGLRVTTTLDVGLQKIAEKWVRLAAIVPHAKDPEASAKALGFDELEPWMANLRDKALRNGALVALDYQTGELVAYVGSASYYSTSTRPAFQPQYDVLGKGYRQPGSAFKPFTYAVGIDDHALTAGTMLMDVGTDFGGDYTPSDADLLERGPVRVRNALQFSLNIPAVKAMAVNGPDHVFAKAQEFGMEFQVDRTDAGLALALGVQEVRPVDLVTAYGTLANGGRAIGHTTILSIRDREGNDADPYAPPDGTQVISPQAAFIVTDILSGNTDAAINPFWGRFAIDGPERRRPATLKTGTNNDAKDLNAYGYIAPPTEDGRSSGAYALAVGVWNGNSDNSLVSTPEAPLFSIDVSTYVWQGFLQEASAKWPETDFAPPADGLVQAEIDPWTGFLAAPGGPSVSEWFLADTQPPEAIPEGTCGEAILTNQNVYEVRFSTWLEADRDWLRRAARGPGVAGGPDRARTSYFYNRGFQPYGASWGPLSGGDGCGSPSPSPSCFMIPTPDPSTGLIPSFVVPSPSGSEPVALPCPPASEEPSASPSEGESPSVEPSPSASEAPSPTPAPTPEPTPTPVVDTPPPDASPPAQPADASPLAPPLDGGQPSP